MEGVSAIVGKGLVEILPDFKKWGSQLAADMRTARAQLDGSAAGLRRSAATVGKSMAQVGKGTAALGLGVAAVSVKMAADFQAHTAVLQTAAGETTKGLATVRQGIKDIAVGTGTGLSNLTEGMYTIEKAGFRGAAGLTVLKAAAQGAREENAKLADVTNAMTSVMASYHLGADKSVQVMNAMKTAAGEGKITMEEFSGALSTVLPIASANKIQFEDVAGSMATLTQHGTSAREATHELAATIRALASPNNVASREMARFGLSAVDVSTKLGQRGLSGTVNMLVRTILSKMGPAGTRLQNAFEGTKQASQDLQIMLGKMAPGVKKVAQEYLQGKFSLGEWRQELKATSAPNANLLKQFAASADRAHGFSRELKNGGPSVQTFTDALKKISGGAIGLNTILQLTGESAAGNAERIKKVGESFHDNAKDVEGWKTTSKLLSVQMDRVKAQIQVMAIDIGTKLIPAVSAVVGYFNKHRDALLDVVIAAGSFLAVTAGMYVAMKLYATYTRLAAIATGAWNLAMQLGSKYALGTRVQLAALFVWQKLQATWTGIVTAAQWAWNAAMTANPIGLIIVGIGLLVGAIVLIATKTQWFQKLWGAIWGFIKKPVTAFANWFKKNWQLITFTIMTLGIGLAVAEIVRHWDGVKHAFSATIDWVKHNWPLLLAIITGPVGLAVLYIVRHWKEVKKGAEDAYHGTIGWFVRMGKDIGSFFSKLPGQISGFFTKSVPHFFESVWKSVSGFFSKLPGRMLGLVNSLGKDAGKANTALLTMGKNLIEGLWKGATDFFTKSVPAFFKTLWAGTVDYFKAVFGIHSPSTVMASLGINLMQGLFSGMLSVLAGIVTFLGVHIGQPITNFFTKTIPNAASWMKSKVVALWQLEYNGLLVVWGRIRKYVLDPIGTFFTKIIPGWASSLKGAVVARWNTLRDGLHGAYASVRGRVFNPIGTFFTKIIPGWASALRGAVVARWNTLRDGLAGAYASIRSRVFNPIGNFFTKIIPGWASTMKSRVSGFFTGMRDGIGHIWSGIESRTKTPVNWVISHIWNSGIYSIWKKITGWIGISDKLGTIRKLAKGGTVGNEPAGVFNRPTAIVGEGNPAHPEFVIPTDPKYRTRALALWKAAGAHFYEGGGILGTIGHAVRSAAGKAVSIGKAALGFLDDPAGQAKKLLLNALGSLSHLGSAPWGQMLAKLPHMAVDGLIDAVKSVKDDLTGGAGMGPSGGSGVTRWTNVVHAMLRQVGQPLSLTGVTLRRMNQESGGNPNIVNTWDSNWMRGTPSVGLMQVIGPTFRSFAGKYRNVGPFKYGVSVNPAANIYSSMKYALGAYGSLSRAYGRAGGYRLGTMGSTSGWHWLGEDGPELAKLPAGTRIRSARDSARSAPAAGTTVHLTVENHGVIGSKQQVEDWLVGSLETLRVKRRLPKALGGTA